MPNRAADAFLTLAAQALHDRFEISHVALQVEYGSSAQGCRERRDLRLGTLAARGVQAHGHSVQRLMFGCGREPSSFATNRRQESGTGSYIVQAQVIVDRCIVGLGVLMGIDRGPRINRAGKCVVILSSGRRPFRLRAVGEERGALCNSAIVPPGAEFVIEGDDIETVTAFVEADGILGRRASYELNATLRRGSTAWIEVGQRLVPADLWACADADKWPMAFDHLAYALDRKRRGLAYAGATVRRAAALVESKLPARVSVAALAGAVNLTPEQLTRQLLDEVGLAARPFVYWLRLRRYASLCAAGATVDKATRATGHRRRSELMEDFQRLFGLANRDLPACGCLTPLDDVSFAEIRMA